MSRDRRWTVATILRQDPMRRIFWPNKAYRQIFERIARFLDQSSQQNAIIDCEFLQMTIFQCPDPKTSSKFKIWTLHRNKLLIGYRLQHNLENPKFPSQISKIYKIFKIPQNIWNISRNFSTAFQSFLKLFNTRHANNAYVLLHKTCVHHFFHCHRDLVFDWYLKSIWTAWNVLKHQD